MGYDNVLRLSHADDFIIAGVPALVHSDNLAVVVALKIMGGVGDHQQWDFIRSGGLDVYKRQRFI